MPTSAHVFPSQPVPARALRRAAVACWLLAPLLAADQVALEGTLAVGGGGAFVDGLQPTFQQRFRQRKDGFGGIESLSVTKTTDASLLRFDRNTRDGTKNSIRWGDSNLPGQPFVPRAFIPSYLVVDEERDSVTAEVSQRTDETNWKVAGRYERTKLGNRHVARRRAREPQDRYVTTYEGASTDLFSGHAFYERIFHEKLRGSAGGLATTIDTTLSGSKIYGGAPDAGFSPTLPARQAGDVGYFGLNGSTPSSIKTSRARTPICGCRGDRPPR